MYGTESTLNVPLGFLENTVTFLLPLASGNDTGLFLSKPSGNFKNAFFNVSTASGSESLIGCPSNLTYIAPVVLSIPYWISLTELSIYVESMSIFSLLVITSPSVFLTEKCSIAAKFVARSSDILLGATSTGYLDNAGVTYTPEKAPGFNLSLA